eukprot:TRINITY_DN1150_c0_g1_i3.p1 TRINITY_DN1150_c0_g1~~TRINITY_DN1150_c0_g1_i3.p1  ORF type:complete len:437 (+),score=63.14 TRINITY_DN1150_c0_g1_i3:196-1506(+)
MSYVEYIEPKLSRFFIFNPAYFGLREDNDYEKVLLYYPATDIREQMLDVGLIEGLVQFASTFSDTPAESCHNEKTRFTIYECEPNWWIVMGSQNPKKIKHIEEKKGKKTVERTEVEWLYEDLDDIVLRNTVDRCYKMFRLFNGPMEMIYQEQGEAGIREVLNQTFISIIQSIKLPNLDLFHTLEGVEFLPVNKNVYLRILSLINYSEQTFDQIKYSTLMYKDSLVWSGLEQDDMRTMYRFLKSQKRNKSGFLSGPVDLNDPNTECRAQRVYIGPESDPHYLIIYQLMDCTVVFLIEESSLNKLPFYVQLDKLLQQEINFLSPIIREYYNRSKSSNIDDQFRYIYFNHMNLALKTSVKKLSLPVEVTMVLNQIHSDFERSEEQINEIVVGTQNHGWIVGKKSDHREFYVLSDTRSANSSLEEISKYAFIIILPLISI